MVVIQGNLFQGNLGEGVDNTNGTSDIDATYNSWGDSAGPAGTNGDGITSMWMPTPGPTSDLYLESSPTPWTNLVLPGYPITYTVKANFVNVVGADFTINYPEGVTAGTPVPGSDGFEDGSVTSGSGQTIHFLGQQTSLAPLTGSFDLFTVTFTSPAADGPLTPVFVEGMNTFSMAPVSGPSTNIYAAALTGDSFDLISAFPTLTSLDLAGPYAAGTPQEFNLTVNNPTAGVAYTSSDLRFSGLPAGAVLEVWNGSAFAPVSGGIYDLGALSADGLDQTVKFQVTFPTAGVYPDVSVALYATEVEPDYELATLSKTATVDPAASYLYFFPIIGK